MKRLTDRHSDAETLRRVRELLGYLELESADTWLSAEVRDSAIFTVVRLRAALDGDDL